MWWIALGLHSAAPHCRPFPSHLSLPHCRLWGLQGALPCAWSTPTCPSGPNRAAPHNFYLRTPFPGAFFCSSAHFHRGTTRTRPCGGTFWNFPGSATFSSQNPSGGSLRQYFSVTSPYFLPGCFFSLLRFHHAMWRKSAPKSHIGLLRLHRCVPTQPSVPRMGGSLQEPDKLYTYLSCSASVTLLAIS